MLKNIQIKVFLSKIDNYHGYHTNNNEQTILISLGLKNNSVTKVTLKLFKIAFYQNKTRKYF